MGKVLCNETLCDFLDDGQCSVLRSVAEDTQNIDGANCVMYYNRCFYCYHECNEDCEHPERYNEDYNKGDE